MRLKTLVIEKKLTIRDSEILDLYLKDIAKENPLTQEEELELIKSAKAGDVVAKETLIKKNLRFVVSVAKQYSNMGVELTDLISEGNIGLMKAIDYFDETKGFKFISYAIWWIRQSILLSIENNSRLIKIPSNKIHLYNKIKKEYYLLEQLLERNPSIKELSEKLNISENTIIELNNLFYNKISSIDENENENDNINDKYNNITNIISKSINKSTDNNLDIESLDIKINNFLDILSQKEKKVIIDYYGLNKNYPKTFEEIAFNMNLSKMRIIQIHNNSIKKLKENNDINVLKKYIV